MKAVYGPDVNQRSVLDGEVKATPAATPFLAAVRGAKEQANTSK
jgi:hypothetical protein